MPCLGFRGLARAFGGALLGFLGPGLFAFDIGEPPLRERIALGGGTFVPEYRLVEVRLGAQSFLVHLTEIKLGERIAFFRHALLDFKKSYVGVVAFRRRDGRREQQQQRQKNEIPCAA